MLIQIGEEVNKVEEGIKSDSSQIPWPTLKGFRNIAVHEYQFVDAEKVFDICTKHINELQGQLENYINNAIVNNSLSAFELTLSKGSEFYTHVRFDKLMNR